MEDAKTAHETVPAHDALTSAGDELLVCVRDLRVGFLSRGGEALAVKDLSLEVRQGETVGIVGESGSGKTVTALALMGLLPKRMVAVKASALKVVGVDLIAASPREVGAMRGGRVGMVFQDSMRSLTPTRRVGDQVAEVIKQHTDSSRRSSRGEAVGLLDLVGIPDAARRARDYPHQFSGGQAQRIMIAIAIACRPKLLIADEPTTALDVTTQAQILELLARLRSELGMGLILITHDLAVVAGVCRRLVVMYAGRVMESGATTTLFRTPKHPYTAALLAAVPRVDRPNARRSTLSRPRIKEVVATDGCPYRLRCALAIDACIERPPLVEIESRHAVACWRGGEHGIFK